MNPIWLVPFEVQQMIEGPDGRRSEWFPVDINPKYIVSIQEMGDRCFVDLYNGKSIWIKGTRNDIEEKLKKHNSRVSLAKAGPIY